MGFGIPRSGGRRFALALVGAVVLLLGAGSVKWLQNAGANTTTAANKVAVAASDLDIINQNQVSNTNGPTTTKILSATIKTSTPEDLVITVNAECGLYTAVGAKGGGSGTSTSSTATGIVTLQPYLDGNPLPTTLNPNPIPNPSVGFPSLPPDGNGPVSFCARAMQMDTANLGLNQMINLFENTRSANSFQWFALNVGNGTHTIDVYATLTSDVAGSGATTTGGTTPAAAAMVGQRTMTIDPDQLANSATF